MARWVGAQGQVTSAKNAKTYPKYDVDKKTKFKISQMSKDLQLEDFPNP